MSQNGTASEKIDYDELTEKIREYTKAHVKESRFEHSKRVAEMCEFLCIKYALNPKKGYLAGIGHDMCKGMSDKELVETASRDGQEITPFEKNQLSLLHGRAAAVLMKEKFGINDADILEAVANHTSGKPGMCNLTKCLFLADKIEPGRPQSTNEYRKKLFEMTLDQMTYSVIKENYDYITAKGYVVYPETETMIKELEAILQKGGH